MCARCGCGCGWRCVRGVGVGVGVGVGAWTQEVCARCERVTCPSSHDRHNRHSTTQMDGIACVAKVTQNKNKVKDVSEGERMPNNTKIHHPNNCRRRLLWWQRPAAMHCRCTQATRGGGPHTGWSVGARTANVLLAQLCIGTCCTHTQTSENTTWMMR